VKHTKKIRPQIKAALDAVVTEYLGMEIDLQIIAYSSLKFAEQGDITIANHLIRCIMKENTFVRVESLISWFESHGKLIWSNKKRKLVNTENGKWNLITARKRPWCESKQLADILEKGEIDYDKLKKPALEDSKIVPNVSLNSDNFSLVIHHYLKENAVNDNPIGNLGLPADKNRYGRYKLRIKRK
jgi:hypothetical protein